MWLAGTCTSTSSRARRSATRTKSTRSSCVRRCSSCAAPHADPSTSFGTFSQSRLDPSTLSGTSSQSRSSWRSLFQLLIFCLIFVTFVVSAADFLPGLRDVRRRLTVPTEPPHTDLYPRPHRRRIQVHRQPKLTQNFIPNLPSEQRIVLINASMK